MHKNAQLVGEQKTETVVITEELVERYASLTGDDNPIHTNEEYASKTIFGEQIAHGMLTMSFVSSALAEYSGVVIYISQDIQFKNPVSIGTEVVANCEIVEQFDGNKYTVETIVKDSIDDTVYITGTAVIMIREEPDNN